MTTTNTKIKNFETSTSIIKSNFLKKIRPLFDSLAKDNIQLVNAQSNVQSFDDLLWNEIRARFNVHTANQAEMIREFIADSYSWTVKRKGKGKETATRLTAPKRFSQFFSDIKLAFECGLIDIDFKSDVKTTDLLTGKVGNNHTTIYKNIFKEFDTIGDMRKAKNAFVAENKSNSFKKITSDLILIKQFANKAEREHDSKLLTKIEKLANELRLELNLAPKTIKIDKKNKTIND